VAVSWPDPVDEILGSDHVVMLAYVTPARGVVLLPVTNFAVRDREAGILTAVNSSVGAWRKLERIQQTQDESRSNDGNAQLHRLGAFA
jgi:hypothetical protein